MPDEDKNFGGYLVLDFRKWWRQVETIYSLQMNICELNEQKRKDKRLWNIATKKKNGCKIKNTETCWSCGSEGKTR